MKMKFTNGFNGQYIIRDHELNINPKAFRPYDLVMAGLSSCLYSTFLDSLNEKGLNIYGCDIDFRYHKKKEHPYVLDKVMVILIVDSNESEFKLKEALDEARNNCSMVYTIEQICPVEVIMKIKPKFSINLF